MAYQLSSFTSPRAARSADCGRQTSITAGTVMHRTKLPLTISLADDLSSKAMTIVKASRRFHSTIFLIQLGGPTLVTVTILFDLVSVLISRFSLGSAWSHVADDA